MDSDKSILNEGFIYLNEETEMNEFHVDDHEEMQKVADGKHPEFGGSISVRARLGEKPIIIFGQDEAIFNQNLSNTFQWVGPNGERPLLPKSSGMRKMISVFQSRVTGWGVDLSEEDLQRINNR